MVSLCVGGEREREGKAEGNGTLPSAHTQRRSEVEDEQEVEMKKMEVKHERKAQRS